MARSAAPGMLDRILDAATLTFIACGYRNARVDAVAARASVSVGTVYRYAENKEALFELVLRRAFRDPDAQDVSLPYRASDPRGHVEQIWQRLARTTPFAKLRAAADAEAPDDVADEFEGIVRETFRWQAKYWKALKLIERCARDWPELAALFYRQFRRQLIALGVRYIERRSAAGLLRPFPDATVAARVVVENCAFFAMHRHTAPDSVMSDDVAEETVVRVLCHAFVPDPVPARTVEGRSS